MIYNLFADRWELSTDTDVNYMVLGEKWLLSPLPALAGRGCPREARAGEGLHLPFSQLPLTRLAASAARHPLPATRGEGRKKGR